MVRVGLIGGTGDIGSALAVQLSKKYDILLGSRSFERAASTVRKILADKAGRPHIEDRIRPSSNIEVISKCETVILAVPYDGAVEAIDGLQSLFQENQLLISAVAAITKSSNEYLPVRNVPSIAKRIQSLIPRSKVAVAFQTIPAKIMYKEQRIDADVLVCCEDEKSFKRTSEIVSCIPDLRPIYVGSLELASEIEGLTALLLDVSIRNHLKNPSFKVQSF